MNRVASRQVLLLAIDRLAAAAKASAYPGAISPIEAFGEDRAAGASISETATLKPRSRGGLDGPPEPRRAVRAADLYYSIGRLRGLGPRGNAVSSADISLSLKVRSRAAAFSAACSGVEPFGIANT